MLKKVLVANRAEIALRVIRACRDLGVRSVAVYSEADRDLRYVNEADEAVGIGPPSARESYLSIDKIIDAAKKTRADSVHPGYGFLAENPELARAVGDAGLVYIGPPAEAIEALGSKLRTRRIMLDAGVPVLPGTEATADAEDARRHADEIGYPVLVKPSGGGGGRGMRVVESAEELSRVFELARSEASASFGQSAVYLEKLLRKARHVEVQVFGDTQGNVVHVGDRDCSAQRRYQKLVEEAPAPGLTEEQRERVRSLAVQAARAAGYVNAGTVEFLYDGEDSFYLLEVNTRIQVEHCASEVASGIDLVGEQIRVASGEPLSFRQEDVTLRGAAIECRVYAEDPRNGFAPSLGTIEGARFPGGPWLREDRGYEVGDRITPYYDGMLAKLIVWGPTREVAIARTLRAIGEYRFAGVKTNVPFLRWLVDTDTFRRGRCTTDFIEREFDPNVLPEEAPFEPPVRPAQAARTARPARPAEEALAPSAATRALRVELFSFRQKTPGGEQDYFIHVVRTPDGLYQAIPVSPATQCWAEPSSRRGGRTAEEAVETLIREVLERKLPGEIFPELTMSF